MDSVSSVFFSEGPSKTPVEILDSSAPATRSTFLMLLILMFCTNRRSPSHFLKYSKLSGINKSGISRPQPPKSLASFFMVKVMASSLELCCAARFLWILLLILICSSSSSNLVRNHEQDQGSHIPGQVALHQDQHPLAVQPTILFLHPRQGLLDPGQLLSQQGKSVQSNLCRGQLSTSRTSALPCP